MSSAFRLAVCLAVLVAARASGAPAEAHPAFRTELPDPVSLRDLNGVGVDAEGRVTVAVLDYAPLFLGPRLIRFLPDGRLDAGFQPQWVGSRITSMVVLRSGKTLVAGTFIVSGDGAARTNLARLNPDGSLDPGFDAGAGWSPAAQLHELPDQQLLVVASHHGTDGVSRPGPHRLLADGRLDETFAPARAWAELRVEAVIPTPGGSVYLIGMIRPRTTDALVRIARTLPDGTVDDAFRYAGDWVHAGWVASPDGGVFVVTQSLRSSLATTVMDVLRLQPDGTPDPAFQVEVSGRNYVIGSGIQNPPFIFSMARQVDGRLLLAGKFDRVNGIARRNVARLEPDGSVDASFNPGTGPVLSSDSSNFGYPLQGMALGLDGSIYLAGPFDRYAGGVYRMVVRLQGDPVPRLRIERSAEGIEASWIGHPGESVEVESSPDLSHWSPYHSFTNVEAVVRLPRPTGEAVFLRARWK